MKNSECIELFCIHIISYATYDFINCHLRSAEATVNETSESVQEAIEDVQQQSSSPLEVVQEETEDALQQSEEIIKNSLAKQTPQIALTA